MLDVLLDVGLDAAVCVSDLSCEPAHALDVAAAEKEGERHDQEDYKGESPVHRAKEYYCSEKLDYGRYEGGNGPCEGVGDSRDVSFETVEHVSGVEGFFAGPAAFHDLDEVAVADVVADADVGLGLKVRYDDVEDYLGEGTSDEQEDERGEGTMDGSGRYVHESLGYPDVGHRDGYGKDADDSDGGYAEPVSSRCAPKPLDMM